MSNLQLVIVNDFAHVNGGTAQVALLSAMCLAQIGHKVVLVSAVPPVMPELTAAGVVVHCLEQEEIATDPNRFRAIRQGIWNNDAERLMKRLLADMDPTHTVVHIHGWTKSLSSSVIAAATKLIFPVVVTMHDYFLACPNGGFYDYRHEHICRRSPLSVSCVAANCDKHSYAQKLWRVGRQVVQRQFAGIPSNVLHYIAISSFSRAVLAPFLPGDARIYSVDNPVDVEKQNRVDVAANDLFVWVGRLTPEKGPLLFARAAAQIGVKAVLVGDGECRDEIMAQAPSAQITGWSDRQTVLKHLSSARSLVFSSLWYETQGLVVLEAASLGIPAIVPDTSAARDLVIDGVTGLWFKGGDAADLKAKMIRMKDPILSSSFGRAAYEQYWSHPMTIDNHVCQLTDIYRRILGMPLESRLPTPSVEAVNR